jgi:exodeoxyribonuclease X
MNIAKIEVNELAPLVVPGEFLLARVIDVETTSNDLNNIDVIEVGWVDVWFPVDGGNPLMGHPFKTFLKPTRPITVESMAVHHITEEEAATGIHQDQLDELIMKDQPDCFVAHNAKFEAALLKIGDKPWLCTLKAAYRVFPDSVRHTNQVLRYALGLHVDPDLSQPPHRAAPDAYVTAHLLIRLAQEVSVEQMLDWTTRPAVLPRVSFGKHKGKTWDQIPDSYFRFILDDGKFDEDVLWNTRNEMERRRTVAETQRAEASARRNNIAMEPCGPG